ncbi:MAG: MFS family permease [Francisella sp.]|jgi:MFS family permease
MNKFKMSLILFVGVGFYCYEFFLRILTGAYQDQIVDYFHIQSHVGFSFLISSYNITYLIMQIPAGILLDRYGSKKVLIAATLICGIGNIIFIMGGFELAIIGRLLVGIGSSFAFIGVLKLALENFSRKHFALVTSIVISLGTLTAAFSQNISVIVSSYDVSWIEIFIYSGLFAIPLAFLFQIILPKQANSMQIMPKLNEIFTISKDLLKNIQLWKNATWGGLIYIPTVVITSQYGILYFKDAYGFDTIYSATMITALFIGWVIFSPINTILCKKISANKIIGLSVLLSIIIILIFNAGIMSNYAMILVFLFGAVSASQVLVWHHFNEICPPSIAAIGIAVTNMIITLVMEIGQLGVGISMDIGKFLDISMNTCISLSFVACLIFALVMHRSLTRNHNKQ